MTRPEGVKIEYCPNCKERSLFWNRTTQTWECLNRKCPSQFMQNQPATYKISFNAPLWLVNILESKRLWKLLICFVVIWWCWAAIQYSGNSLGLAIGLAFPILLLYIIKLLLRKFLGNYKTLAAQHRISQAFYPIRKSSFLRFAIIVATITLLVTTIWSMISFIYRLVHSASLVYLFNMLVLIIAQTWLLSWLCGTLKHSRQISKRPKLAVVFWSLFAVAIFCAFVGISPFSDIKDTAVATISNWWEQATIASQPIEPPIEVKKPQATIPPSITIPKPIAIPEPITMPEPTLRDPTWNQLLEFLKADNTDAHPYIYPTFVCANFAKMLQDNAHKAGWRCAIVDVKLSGYPDFYNYGIPSETGHSCNAFKTMDRGLVYVDVTRSAGIGPANQDNIVYVQVGKQYIPQALFPTPGWYSSSLSMGIVVSVSDPQW